MKMKQKLRNTEFMYSLLNVFQYVNSYDIYVQLGKAQDVICAKVVIL